MLGRLAHVERGTRPLVPAQPGRSFLVRHDPRRDRADGLIAEVRQQPVQPPRPRHAVGVEKRHQGGRGDRQPGVPRRSGSPVDRPADDARPVLGADRRDRLRIGGAIVHDDHVRQAAQPGQAPGQFRVPVPHRNHDRHVSHAGRAGSAWSLGRRPSPGARSPRPAAAARASRAAAGRPPATPRNHPADRACPGRRQPQHPHRRPADEHRARPRPAASRSPPATAFQPARARRETAESMIAKTFGRDSDHEPS